MSQDRQFLEGKAREIGPLYVNGLFDQGVVPVTDFSFVMYDHNEGDSHVDFGDPI